MLPTCFHVLIRSNAIISKSVNLVGVGQWIHNVLINTLFAVASEIARYFFPSKLSPVVAWETIYANNLSLLEMACAHYMHNYLWVVAKALNLACTLSTGNPHKKHQRDSSMIDLNSEFCLLILLLSN